MDAPPSLSHPPSGPGRVLVVDDEEKNRELLVDSLQQQGYEVSQAENGEIALKLVREKSPDVILLDAMMPQMDGFETCRWIRKEPVSAAIPILMITSLTDRDDRLRGIEAGVNDFLSKPIDLQDVLLRVRNAVQLKRLFDQLHQSLHRVKELEAIRDNLTTMLLPAERFGGRCGAQSFGSSRKNPRAARDQELAGWRISPPANPLRSGRVGANSSV